MYLALFVTAYVKQEKKRICGLNTWGGGGVEKIKSVQ